MRIENLRTERDSSRARIIASVTWEDSDRQNLDVFFETEDKFAEALTINPHSFLIAGALAAMHHFEERIYIDAEICPELDQNLNTAMRWIYNWYEYYRSRKSFLRIDAKGYSNVIRNTLKSNAGFFLSGGVDSLAILRANHLIFSSNHPGYFKYGLLVYGLEIEKQETFEYVKQSISDFSAEVGVTLIPVYTNIRYLDDDWSFWGDEFEGAVFASVAHAFSNLFSVISIASSFDIPNIHPHGSHPLLDSNYSSCDLRIRHDLTTLSRLEKIKLLVDWEPALRYLRVCNKTELYKSNQFNCSKCEKCIRTMLGLLVHGALNRSSTFQVDNITEELVSNMEGLNDTTFPFYPELAAALRKTGRHDLVRAIELKIAEYKEPKWKTNLKKVFRYEEPGWKINSKIGIVSLLSEIDRFFLKDKLKQNPRVKKFKRSIFN